MMNSDDEISLHSLSLIANIGSDCWSRVRPQPVLLTVRAYTSSLATAAETDDIQHTIHYGHLANLFLGLQSLSFSSLLHLATSAISAVFNNSEFSSIHTVHIHAEAPKLLLQGRALSVDLSRTRHQPESELTGTIEISDLALPVIIGVNPPERIHKQQVIVSISFPIPPSGGGAWLNPSDPPHHQILVQRITEHISTSDFFTLEALVSSIACAFFQLSGKDGGDQVSVQVRKPAAVTHGEGSGVRLTRTRSFFAKKPVV